MSEEENIQYPPFCDLCLVKFTTNYNARSHFRGDNHRNKIMLIYHRVKNNPNLKWCEICCCELNTVEMLNTHKQSDKHKRKEMAQVEIFNLKQEYLALMNKNQETDNQTAEIIATETEITTEDKSDKLSSSGIQNSNKDQESQPVSNINTESEATQNE